MAFTRCRRRTGTTFWDSRCGKARKTTSATPASHSASSGGIAGEQAGFLEGLSKLLVEANERTGDAVAHGASLAGRATTADVDQNVELPAGVRDLERLGDDHPKRLTRKVILEGAAIHGDAALP